MNRLLAHPSSFLLTPTEGEGEERGFRSHFHLVLFQVKQTEQLGAHQHFGFPLPSARNSCELHNTQQGTAA